MPKDALGREAPPNNSLTGDYIADRRTRAIADFQFLMQYRRDLREARELVAQVYPGNETRLDVDITRTNTALRNAVIELEASR